eukprot:749533-Pyramimonas_sp.AAC.1
MDIGWAPHSPMQWESANETWTIPSYADVEYEQFHSDFTDILRDIEDTIARQLWGGTSKHDNGSDLCEGADTYQVSRELRALRGDDGSDDWAMNVVVTTGSQWHRERLQQAGYNIPSLLCPRCQQAPESLFHRTSGMRCQCWPPRFHEIRF